MTTTSNGASTHVRTRSEAKAIAAAKNSAAWNLPTGLREHARCALDLISEAERPANFVIDRLAEAGDVMLLAGVEKDSLKTWGSLGLGLARIIGAQWLGFDVVRARPQRVLFISTETRAPVLVRRLLALCPAYKADPAVVSKFLYIIDQPVTLVSRAERERVRNKAFTAAKVAAIKIVDPERRSALAKGADTIGDHEVTSLGHNVDLLDAIAVPDTWSLIIVDTLRQCLSGDENSSKDAAAFMAAARELARDCKCVVVIVHHTNKTGTAGEARSSRGSGEITAAPDVLVSIDATGEYPTAHFKIRNHEPVEAVGYKLVTEGDGVRLEILPPCAGRTKDLAEDDVLAIFRAHPDDGLSVSTLRKLVAAARGGKKGAKADPKAIKRHLDALEKRGVISRCEITQPGRKAIEGHRLGSSGGKVPMRRIDIDGEKGALEDFLGGPNDV